MVLLDTGAPGTSREDTVRMPMGRLELATTRLEIEALTIELNSSIGSVGKESSLSSWCIASSYIYHFSSVVDFSSEKYNGSAGHRWYSWYQQALTIELSSSVGSAGKESSLSRWCIASLIFITSHLWLTSFPALAIELFSSMARPLDL